MIWKKQLSLDALNAMNQGSAVSHLGIEISHIGEDFLEATMPVDSRTSQPFGFLHGGISCALAETLGSLGAYLTLEEGRVGVGLEINANHLRPVKQGFVRAKATPIAITKNTQVWQIDIRDNQDKLCCVSRLTLSIINL